MKNKDFVGLKIGDLNITGCFSSNGRQFFECVCVCGLSFMARVDSVKVFTTKSCGCLTGELIASKTRLPNNMGAFNLVMRHYKSNAKKRGLHFSLSVKEFQSFILSNCYYCGSPPRHAIFHSSSPNRKDKELSYNGIDRVDNTIGYTMDNCVSCCSICNAAKSDLTHEEFSDWINRLVGFNAKKDIEISS